MTKLIIKIAKEDSNTFLSPSSIESTLQSEMTNDTIVASPSLSTRIRFDARDGETVRVMETVSAYGLGFGEGKSYVRSQDVPLCYESPQIERGKRCSRMSEGEDYDVV